MIQPQYAQQQMQYPQPATGAGASAVSINIHNPQAFAGPQQQMPMQSPYTQQLYGYPQAPIYGAMPQQYQPYPYAMPPMPQYMPQQQMQAPQVYPPVQQPMMPEPVLAPDAQVPQQIQQPQQPQAVEQPQVAQPTQAPQEATAPAPSQAVDLAGINQGLASTDLNAQTEAITQVAQFSQQAPEVALQVVDNQVMNNLINIIQKDTSTLAGPTPEQIAIAEKAKKGEKLTPEEEQVAAKSSERELAEKNKVFAMFTQAMLQKIQRDEVDNYNTSVDAANAVPAPKIQDLPGYQQIVDTINSTQIPAVKAAGIQALAYTARPEDAAEVEKALTPVMNELNAAKDKADPVVAAAFKEAVAKVKGAPAQAPGTAAAAPQEAAPVPEKAAA